MAFGFVAAAPDGRSALFTSDEYAQQRAFFSNRATLTPTPLLQLPALASTLGIGDIRAKDETARYGLNAFKAVGAIFAVSALKQRGDLRTDDTLACASEGNHGRAVAHAARAIGCAARVYLSTNVAPARVRAIESEGAHVVRVPGTYDDAVRAMVRDARARGWRVISDTALGEDDREIPRLIMLGYTRLMDEAAAQWGPDAAPDAIFVPGGVGGLLAAVADWARALGPHPPAVVAVEPTTAACLQASARAGQPVALPGPFESMMAGLRCGEVSRAAFETVRDNVAAYVAIEDEWAAEAMRRLAAGSNTDPPILAGASGAAALGGLLAVVRDPALAPVKEALGLGGDSRALILVTEGVTDPELFASIVPNPKNEQSGLKNREP